jgi:hypothetical protein
MLPKRVQVIKWDQIDLQGTVQLSSGTVADAADSGMSCGAAASAGHKHEARIVESHPDYAILEIVCGCGFTSHIQCQYANA